MRTVALPTIPSMRQAVELGVSADQLFEEALARAAAAGSSGSFISRADERRPYRPLGPLAGVSFAVKDNIDTCDLPTTGGTNALRGSVPPADAPAVAALRAAGASLLGKANLHELAFGVTSNNHAFTGVRHPTDPARSPGGSSGGSAVAVALGIVPFALGTDTGGSIRIPAAHCGVVGYRPTTGRWGAQGVVPLSHTRDTIGVITHTIADAELVDRVVTGHTRPFGSPDFETSRSPLDLRGVRIGVPRAGFYDDMDPRISTKIEATLDALEEAGVVLVEIDCSWAQEIDAQCGLPLVVHETGVDLPSYLRTLRAPYAALSLTEITAHVASPDVRKIMELVEARSVSVLDYERCLALRRQLQASYAHAFATHDVAAVVYPTVPMAPPPRGDDVTTIHNGRPVEVFQTSTRNTGPGSVAGIPSVSLPVALGAPWPPVGCSVEGPAGEDRSLLRLAAALETVIS